MGKHLILFLTVINLVMAVLYLFTGLVMDVDFTFTKNPLAKNSDHFYLMFLLYMYTTHHILGFRWNSLLGKHE